jgi:hypothetical protein
MPFALKYLVTRLGLPGPRAAEAFAEVKRVYPPRLWERINGCEELARGNAPRHPARGFFEGYDPRRGILAPWHLTKKANP